MPSPLTPPPHSVHVQSQPPSSSVALSNPHISSIYTPCFPTQSNQEKFSGVKIIKFVPMIHKEPREWSYPQSVAETQRDMQGLLLQGLRVCESTTGRFPDKKGWSWGHARHSEDYFDRKSTGPCLQIVITKFPKLGGTFSVQSAVQAYIH